MSHSGMWVMFWADLHHKMARRAACSLNASNGKDVIKRLNKLFRMPRRPFHSGRFGKQLAESRQVLTEHIKNNMADESLLEGWLPGVARDQGVSQDAFGMNELLALLQKKSGRVGVSNRLYFLY